MKFTVMLLFLGVLSCSTCLWGQDLATSRVAIISFSGGINEEVLNGLDPRNTNTTPYTSEEEALQDRIRKRIEKRFLDGVHDLLQKQLAAKGIQLEPLSTSGKVATLNEKGFPNPLSPKSVIKKKNDDVADYFLNVNIVCAKPTLGGLGGFKPIARIRLVLHDGSGAKIKTINEEVKWETSLKSTDFDEAWTRTLERFNRMDWYAVSLLQERLLPVVEAVVVKGVEEL